MEQNEITFVLDNRKPEVFNKLYEDFLKNRILILNQDIEDKTVDDIVTWIIKWNIDDLCLGKKDRKPITIFIHSYGGYVQSANPIIDAIQTSETPIRVVGLGIIASAAYLIYLAADERYAFNNSVFLQHDGEIELSNNATKAKDTMAFFDDMNERIKQYVLERSDMDEKTYDKNESRELYMYADKAKEYGIVHKIIGEDITLKQIFKD